MNSLDILLDILLDMDLTLYESVSIF